MAGHGDYLELTSAGRPPVRIALTKARIQIGRSSVCDLRLSGAYVSRRHARLERNRQHGWRIIDLGSANGTHLNGRRINVAAVSDGDVVGVGTHRIVVHLERKAAPLTGTETGLEIMPSDGATIVAGRLEGAMAQVVPARLLADLHRAGRRLGRAPDIEWLLEALAREFHMALRPTRLAVGREDGPQCQWPIVIGRDGRPADGSDLPRLLVPRVEALDSSIAVSLSQLAEDQETTTDTQARNAHLFPVKAGERRLGHVYVELAPGAAAATGETMQLLSLLSRQAALVWENLELGAARQAADELHREMNAARQIQLRLFPRSLDLDPALDAAAENVPALTISGDYYDCQLLEPGRVLFILADVMGHGLPSALVMAGVQALFRTGVRAAWSLAELDRRIHDAVEASGDGETFVSGILGLCDVVDHRITLLSAGHAWPSILCGDQPVERDNDACTGLWGITADRSPRPATFDLGRGPWSVVAYTDGVPDAAGPGGSYYGTERLVEVHRRNRGSPAKEICSGILDDVLRCSDPSCPQEDDMTLLVLRAAAKA